MTALASLVAKKPSQSNAPSCSPELNSVVFIIVRRSDSTSTMTSELRSPRMIDWTMSASASFLVSPTSFIQGLPKRGPYQIIPRNMAAATLARMASQLREEKGNIIKELKEYKEL